MKKYLNISLLLKGACMTLFLMGIASHVFAQETVEPPVEKKAKPVKNTFGGVWLIDNQTVMVPVKGTLEFDIQHRFGTVENGRKDLWGLLAPSNIRLGLSYSPINKLNLGVGVTKERIQVDFNAKYALLQQNTSGMPVSVSYYGNAVIDARDKSYFRESVHRFSFFNQLMVARKVTDRLSLQIAPSLSWFNNVEAYVDEKGNIEKKMNNYHIAISTIGRFRFTESSSIIIGYDQPLTQHLTNNPHPNISFGIETTTSSHTFQVFAGNYYSIVPQSNHMYNTNDLRDGQFVIGFNMSRLWNF